MNQDAKDKLIEKIYNNLGSSEEIIEILRIDIHTLIEEEALRRLQAMDLDELIDLL